MLNCLVLKSEMTNQFFFFFFFFFFFDEFIRQLEVNPLPPK